MEFSEEQEIFLKKIRSWVWQQNVCNELILTGYAGTGKTTLISEVKKLAGYKRIAFLAYTGKASVVLRKKLFDTNNDFNNDFIGTIHSFMYKPILRYNQKLKIEEIIGWEKKEDREIDADMIIIDEASMLDDEITKDIRETFSNIPILYVLDPFQLPPINQKFCSLMSSYKERNIPVYSLTQIHRQNEGNEIIRLSKYLRENERIFIKDKKYSDNLSKVKFESFDKVINKVDMSRNDIVCLTHTNKVRNEFNEKVRQHFKFKHPEPYPNEKVICTQNNRGLGVYNGEIGNVLYSMYEEENILNSIIDFEDRVVDLNIDMGRSFGKTKEKKEKGSKLTTFEYGYMITVHKSQGSQWNTVILFDIKTMFRDPLDYRRWLYTAITRSSDKVIILGD